MARKRRKLDRQKRLEHEFETMLPEQLFQRGGRGALQPEKRLMLAVLEDAVTLSLRHPAQRDTRETLAWFGSDDTSWPYSFANVCDALELERDAVRGALERQWARRNAVRVAA